MRIKLEKPLTLKESLLKKEALVVEQKLEKKVKIKAKNKLAPLTEQESRLIEQNKKQEKTISKEASSRKRTKVQAQPETFATTPIDEREQYRHEQEIDHSTLPENIPLAEDFTEDFDNLSFADIVKNPERTHLKRESLDRKNLEKNNIPYIDEGLDNSGLKEILGIKDEEMSYEEITNSIKELQKTEAIKEVVSTENSEEYFDEDDIQVLQNPARESMNPGWSRYRSNDVTNREWKNFKTYLGEKNPDLLKNLETPPVLGTIGQPTDSAQPRIDSRFDTFKQEQKKKGIIRRVADFFSGVRIERDAIKKNIDSTKPKKGTNTP